jgi:hypothetical protein
MSNRIICAAFPYLVVSGDDDDEGRTMRFSNSAEAIAWLHKRYGSGDDMGKRMKLGVSKPSKLTPQEVITAVFGKPSGNVVWKGAGMI